MAAVAYGFVPVPRRDVFHVRTTTPVFDPDGALIREHQLLAVKVEVARLWLLFLPTFLAIAFLVITAAHGTTRKIRLLDRLFGAQSSYVIVMGCRILLVAVTAALSTWIGERKTLRDAHATSAMSASIQEGGRVSYVFLDPDGSYCGGESFAFNLIRPVTWPGWFSTTWIIPTSTGSRWRLFFTKSSLLGTGSRNLTTGPLWLDQ
jgi:hypothetical protein